MNPIIDAHVHLWDPERLRYDWLGNLPVINSGFFVEDFQNASTRFEIDKMVVVQAECLPEQYLEEVKFIQSQALKDKRIQGIVAYAPLEDTRHIAGILKTLKAFPLVKGIRRMYDNDPALCCSSAFISGLHLLPAFDFSFDISIKPHLMKATIRMIEKCPQTRFVLDHLGKPDILHGRLDDYRQNMDILSSFSNVKAKISGLVTEASLENWTTSDLAPYVDHALKRWGFERLLYGGDWPVVLQASSYEKWIQALLEILKGCPKQEMTKLFYENAQITYRL